MSLPFLKFLSDFGILRNQVFPFLMISQKIVSEFSPILGNFSSITLDLLPKALIIHRTTVAGNQFLVNTMVDSLHNAIRSMSLEEEEPLTLPDNPRFRVYEENEKSLLGRL